MIRTIEVGRRGKTFKKVETFDETTGEVRKILMIGNPQEFDKNFSKVFHAFTEELLKNEEIAGKAIRLLFWIMKNLEYGSIEFYMYPVEVAEELVVTKVTVYNWIKTLTKHGIIRKIKPNMYQLNPSCVVKGEGHTLIEEFIKGEKHE